MTSTTSEGQPEIGSPTAASAATPRGGDVLDAAQAAASGTNSRHQPKQHIGLLFLGLMLTMLMASLNQTVLSTALPTIVGELHGVNHMSWVITAYILASTIMMPIYGRISDLFGRKPVMLAAIVIFMCGSVVGATVGSIGWLIVARVIQGLGGGGLMILSQAAIADVVPARERGKYMGAMGSVFAVTSVAGPLLGGWLTEGPGWRWAFWINPPLGVVAIVAVVLFLHLPRRHARGEQERIDYLGMALLAAGTTVLVLILTWGGNQYDWLSPVIIFMALGGLGIAGLFLLAESRAANPVIPLGLFRERNFVLTSVSGLMVGIAMFGAIGYMPTYLQMVTGVDATRAGLLMTPMMGCLLIASVISGWLVSRTGRYKVFPILGLAITIVGLALLSTLKADSQIPLLGTYIGILGVGIGLCMQILTLIVQNTFPGRIVGTATAANNYFRQVGSTLGSAMVGSAFVSRLTNLLTEKLPASATGGGAGGAAGAGGAGGGLSGGIKSLTPAAVDALPDALRIPIIESYNQALMPIFIFMIPLVAIALITAIFLVEKPLATSVHTERVHAEVSDALREIRGSVQVSEAPPATAPKARD